jgi:hypothetical protein
MPQRDRDTFPDVRGHDRSGMVAEIQAAVARHEAVAPRQLHADGFVLWDEIRRQAAARVA